MHFSTQLLLGGGSASLDRYRNGEFIAERSEKGTLVLIPMVGAEMNLVSWFKMGIMAGYQYVGDSNRATVFNNLNAPVLQLQFKFGFFAER